MVEVQDSKNMVAKDHRTTVCECIVGCSFDRFGLSCYIGRSCFLGSIVDWDFFGVDFAGKDADVENCCYCACSK